MRVLVGREAPADLVVPAGQVSARHASLEPLGGGRYRLTDLGSTNGTYVNGLRVSTAEVSAADEIRLGSYHLEWRLVEAHFNRARPRTVWTVGRDLGNDLVIPDPRVSATHAAMIPLGDGRLELRDLGSSNGVLVNGRRIERAEIRQSDAVSFGSFRVNLFVLLRARGLLNRDGAQPGGRGGTTVLTIGRAQTNDIVMPDPRVSAQHCRVSIGAHGVRLEDLGSTNGTYVDGRRVSQTAIWRGSSVQLGTMPLDLYSLIRAKGVDPDAAVQHVPPPPAPRPVPSVPEPETPSAAEAPAATPARRTTKLVAAAVFLLAAGAYAWYAVQAGRVHSSAVLAESRGHAGTARMAYETVVKAYPGTPHAHFSRQALAQLPAPRSATRRRLGGAGWAPPSDDGAAPGPGRIVGAALAMSGLGLLVAFLLPGRRRSSSGGRRPRAPVLLSFPARQPIAALLLATLFLGLTPSSLYAQNVFRDLANSTRDAVRRAQNSNFARQFDSFKNNTSRQLQDVASRFGEETSRRISDTIRTHGPRIGEDLGRAYQRFGTRVGDEIRTAYDKWGPAAGAGLRRVYEQHGPAMGQRLRQAYDRYGPQVGESLRTAFDRYGAPTGERLVEACRRYGPEIGMRLTQAYAQYGPEVGDRLRTTFDRHGPKIGRELADAFSRYGTQNGNGLHQILESAGEKTYRTLLESYDTYGQQLTSSVQRAYLEHGQELGGEAHQLLTRVAAHAADPEFRQQALDTGIRVATLYNSERRQVAHEILSLAMDNIAVSDGRGGAVSLTEFTGQWVSDNVPYLRGSSIAEDPAEVLTYGVMFFDLGYVVSDLEIIRDDRGEFQSIGDALLAASPFDADQVLTTLEIVESFETIADGDATSEDVVAAAHLLNTAQSLRAG